MQYTTLGNSGLVVSKLSMGTMTFGQGPMASGMWKNKMDQKTAEIMVNRAMEAGINFFDTADMYTNGQAEMMLGKALRNRRKDVIISTKCGFRSGEALISSGLSYRYVIQAVEASLKRLNTDYIDILLIHIPDPATPLTETCRALEEVVQRGWVRYTGYCNYPAWQAQKMLDIQDKYGYSRFITSQMYYSLLSRDIEFDVAPFLQTNGLGLMVWSPLSGGFLTGKYTKENPKPKDARRAEFDFPPVDEEKGYEIIDRMNKMAVKYNATIPRIALAWVMSKPFVSTVIIGASKMHQLEDNLKAADLELDAEDLQALDELSQIPARYPQWMLRMGFDQKVKEALEKKVPVPA